MNNGTKVSIGLGLLTALSGSAILATRCSGGIWLAIGAWFVATGSYATAKAVAIWAHGKSDGENE